MKYQLSEKVIFVATGKECIIVATKDEPWVKNNDPYMRKEVFPNKDYLILTKNDNPDSKFNYLGELDVFEHEIAVIAQK